MNVKFVPNLFLEVVELNRFKESLDLLGFRKNLLENSERFGLIKNQKQDPFFYNGKVERDLDNVFGEKTIKVRNLFAIDQFGQFIYQDTLNSITISNDGNWYWVRASYQINTLEKGTFSISAEGNLVGSSDAELTKIFRGQPNFPTRIKFSNSANNTLEYDVLEVIDDQNAVLQHPALNLGNSEFVAESNLKFSIVGTFTPGVAIPSLDKYPFQYDGCNLELVVETTPNVRPSYVVDSEFYLARVKVVGSNLVVQDKRIEYWETKGSQKCSDIERTDNPLIGVESIKWNSELSSADKNIVELAWGMRSQNWSVDSSQNILTLFGSAVGGKFKAPTDFTDGDFDGWRVYTYTKNSKYSRVISSIKQGSAINLTLDILDVDNYSSDGGVTFHSSDGYYVLVVPDCDAIDIKFIPNPVDNQPYMERVFSFPINSLVGKCEVAPYLDVEDENEDDLSFYNVQYRYKSYKDFTEFRPLPSDEINGFWSEKSFLRENGNFKPDIGDRIQKTYTSHIINGFIPLEICPWSIYRFRDLVFKGDIIGVNTITSLPSNLITLTVGSSKRYQYITGSITLPGDDVVILLDKTGAVEGNEFRIHLNCSSLDLNTKTIIIVADEGGGITTTLKTIRQGDIYMMKNINGGIVFDCIFTDQNSWKICYQNYDLGRPGEIITLDGVITDLFDATSKLGKVVGLYGYALCDGTVGGVPDLRNRFIIGAGGDHVVGANGGSNQISIATTNLPAHNHSISDSGTHQHEIYHPTVSIANGAGDSVWDNVGTPDTTKYTNASGNHNHGGATGNTGDGTPLSHLPPYYALIYAKKLF